MKFYTHVPRRETGKRVSPISNIVKVLTGKSLQTMFTEGGTGIWKANPERVKRCRYVVCVRNIHAGWSEYDHPHSTAFVVGRGLSIIPVPDEGRITIGFSEYAKINIPNSWDGSRNPVAYLTSDQLEIDLEKQDWQPFPNEQVNKQLEIKPLTIPEAKQGIAKALGISVEHIEILIKV